MTQLELLTLILPLAMTVVFQAIEYIDKRKHQQVLVAISVLAFAVVEILLVLQTFR